MSFPQWKGLWDWSMRHNDGTTPSGFQGPIDHEKLKWLEGALKEYMQDFAARMKEIKAALDKDVPLTTSTSSAAGSGAGDTGASVPAAAASRGTGKDQDQDASTPCTASGTGGASTSSMSDLEEREALLEELMDIVASIDFARDLHKIGGLPTMLELLEGPYPSLVWRAAEVVATCVQNNSPVQQWFLDGGVLPLLIALLAPSRTATERVKGLLALSGLVRHFTPGLEALRSAGGLQLVAGCLASEDARETRKAMSLLQYMLSKRRGDASLLLSPSSPPVLPMLIHKLDSDDADQRQASLSVLLALAQCGSSSWQQLTSSPNLLSTLAKLRNQHNTLSAEDKEALQDELDLIDSLVAVLSSTEAPACAEDVDDEVTPVQYEQAAGRGPATIHVNAPPSASAPRHTIQVMRSGSTQQQEDAAAAKDTGSAGGNGTLGVGAGHADDGGSGVGTSGPGAQQQQAQPMLLLGPP